MRADFPGCPAKRLAQLPGRRALCFPWLLRAEAFLLYARAMGGAAARGHRPIGSPRCRLRRGGSRSSRGAHLSTFERYSLCAARNPTHPPTSNSRLLDLDTQIAISSFVPPNYFNRFNSIFIFRHSLQLNNLFNHSFLQFSVTDIFFLNFLPHEKVNITDTIRSFSFVRQT